MHTAQPRTADRLGANARACATGLVFLCLGACGADHGDGAYDDVGAQVYPSTDGGTAASGDAGVDAGPPPAFTASVTATGVGCPASGFHADVREDGKIKLSYDAFEVSVGEGTSEAIEDCQITVALSAQSGAAYAVTSYAHYGTAVLAEGVTGKQSSSYYFPNARFAGRLRNSMLTGPMRGMVMSEPLAPDDVQWTPCALQHQLRITHRLVLQNGGKGALGTLSFASGEHGGAGAELSLKVRACVLPPPPATAR